MNVSATLAAQQGMLLQVLDRVGFHASRGDRTRLRLSLEELRQALKAHLDLEDAEVYPTLAPTESGLAQDFAGEMAPVWRTFCDFADQHVGTLDSMDLELFAAEWEPIAESLRARLEAEELALLPVYRRLAVKSAFLRRVA